MAQVLDQYERSIKDVTLIPSDGGRFEVVVNGDLIYSKLETGRHMDEGEMATLIGKYLSDHEG
jgi:selenoprotein W-related protein